MPSRGDSLLCDFKWPAIGCCDWLLCGHSISDDSSFDRGLESRTFVNEPLVSSLHDKEAAALPTAKAIDMPALDVNSVGTNCLEFSYAVINVWSRRND